MKHAATLIEKFLRDECNENEVQLVKAYIARHPEVLQPYLTEESWHSFHPEEALPEQVSGRMMEVIVQHAFRKRSSMKRYYTWAAVLLLLISGGLLWLFFPHAPAAGTAMEVSAKANVVQETPMLTKVNHLRKTMLLHLSDGSIVELAPGSEVQYRQHFAGNRRDVYLKGQALFRVVADKDRPFTVYAGRLGTTALGTVFSVTAWEGKGVTQVQLISGKVVVRPEHVKGSHRMKDVYLAPGQHLQYDQHKMLASVSMLNKAGIRHNRSITPALVKEVMVFNNEPLVSIFRRLSEKHGVEIRYMESELTGMNFTGVFDGNKETLEDFLATIGTLNGLAIHHKNHIVYIGQ